VPVVQQAFNDFSDDLKSQNRAPPYFSLLSDMVASGVVTLGPSGHLGDSITIQFGVRPIATRSLNSLAGHGPVLVEERAALVFSQAAASGGVVALIYPPTSSLSKPTKDYFLVDVYNNPRLLTKKRAVQLLCDLLEVDSCCSTQNSPSATSGKVLAKLQAREAALQGTNNSVFIYLRYLGYLARGLWKVYRATHASP